MAKQIHSIEHANQLIICPHRLYYNQNEKKSEIKINKNGAFPLEIVCASSTVKNDIVRLIDSLFVDYNTKGYLANEQSTLQPSLTLKFEYKKKILLLFSLHRCLTLLFVSLSVVVVILRLPLI